MEAVSRQGSNFAGPAAPEPGRARGESCAQHDRSSAAARHPSKVPRQRDRCLENRSPPLRRMRHEAAIARVFWNGAQWHGGCYPRRGSNPEPGGQKSWPSTPSCFTSSSRLASWLWPLTPPAASDPDSRVGLPSLVPAHRPSGDSPHPDSPHHPHPTPAKRPVGQSDGARPPGGRGPRRRSPSNPLRACLTLCTQG
jgi:hypothetical protein